MQLPNQFENIAYIKVEDGVISYTQSYGIVCNNNNFIIIQKALGIVNMDGS